MNNLITLSSVLLYVLFLTSSPSIDAAIYKWKDDNGQIHYSAIAPEGIAKDNIETEITRFSQITSQTAESSNNTDSNLSSGKEADTSDEQKGISMDSGYCKQQQDIIQALEKNPYVKWKVDDKETLLEGEAKAAQVKKIQEEMQKLCSEEAKPT